MSELGELQPSATALTSESLIGYSDFAAGRENAIGSLNRVLTQRPPSIFVSTDASGGELDKFQDGLATWHVAFDQAADDDVEHRPPSPGCQVIRVEHRGQVEGVVGSSVRRSHCLA